MAGIDSRQKRRVLFVDDDPLILQGLQRVLRLLRNDWELHFAESGPHALERLEALSFDVVVTDMQMPGMSGAELLVEVQKRHPRTVRIILSGQADQDQLMRCIGCAHRFLPKPCDPTEITAVLASVSAIQDSVAGERFREMVARMTRIPSVPALYLEIVRTLQNPDSGLDDVAAIVIKDLGTTAGLLKVVNSAYFGLHRRVADPLDAVRFLGIDMVRTLVLAVGAFAQFNDRDLDGFSLEQLWHHSMVTGALAREIARVEGAPAKLQDECFVAGLLHDLGKLVLAENLPDDWARVYHTAKRRKCAWHIAEHEEIGVTHADIGGSVLGLWGLPTSIIDAVAFHHTPGTFSSSGMFPVLYVHCADAFVPERSEGDSSIPAPALDLPALRKVGLADRVAEWKTLVGKLK